MFRALFLIFISAACLVTVNGEENVHQPEDGGRWWYAPSRKAHRRPSLERIKFKQEQLEDAWRLPGDLSPVTYYVRLLPFIEVGNWTTAGFVEVLFNCVRDTHNITVNSAELVIDQNSIKVTDVLSNNQLEVTNYIDEQLFREMITIEMASSLKAGQMYSISMEFTSILNDRSRGFYRTSYEDKDGRIKYMAVTQFESADARRAFPCFDEPNMKANFTMTIGRKESMTSVSNMPLLRTEPISGVPGYVWDIYETSVRMSSYLVAVMVSEHVAFHADQRLSNVEFRIWGPPDERHLTEYANNIAPKMLEFFESFFGIDFPLPKLDMAAVPNFPNDAMENWGLILYKDSELLIDPATASAEGLKYTASLIAHELAHQWFGNLVTMDWWNAIWLNEGLTDYMEHLATDVVEPTFRTRDQFILDNLHYVFEFDALETSRPLNYQPKSLEEVESMFDAISYEKGSCVARMLANFLGTETFRRGLSRYLMGKAYVNVNQDDLWNALQDQVFADGLALPTTVKDIMDTWSYKMGYPLITVTRDYQKGEAAITQERFLLRKSNSTADNTVYQWWVPLSYTTDFTLPKSTQWISKDESSKTLTRLGVNRNQWVIFNVDQENYYRVAYDEENYGLIRDQLVSDHLRISDNNRAQLLDDTFVLASVNKVPYTQALDLTLYLKNEREYVPWKAVSDELLYIDNMLYNTVHYANWQRYLTVQMTPFFDSIGFKSSQNDVHLAHLARSDAMFWACRLGVASCVRAASEQYAQLMQQPDSKQIISINHRTTVLRTAIENGGQREWDFAFNQFLTMNDTAYLTAATASKNPETLSRLLEQFITPNSGIRTPDTLFTGVASNLVGNEIALNFLIDRWDDIKSRWRVRYTQAWFHSICKLQNTSDGLAKLLKLREDHLGILGNSNKVEEGLEIVRHNINWRKLHLLEIGSWLANNGLAQNES